MPKAKASRDISSALLEVQKTLKYAKRKPKTKEEATEYLMQIRRDIRVCKKLLKQAEQYPMMGFTVKPAKRMLDSTEKTLKAFAKELS